MLQITHHAQARLQQRGIPANVVENLLAFGRHAYDHWGGTILFFDHKARNQLRRQIANESYKQIESHLDTYAVLGADGVIVTVGHRTQRINRH
ncbi:MAG: hypothetical protein J5X22_12060 [Candidatus Accumulibacter sp.]|uniref:DUF4258 domain-containing protein n=1 Tax=Accumulibacter sp. TaxID=2053492 RepID=UPI001ACB3FEF|nr:DUF4258 domain-containing protein [Accumulibacter sp.]MBN8518570.1 hypothetical protein [Accumulibacter sp.]MBO3711217.1 hypothetical protein [Accumulibacter sp.]